MKINVGDYVRMDNGCICKVLEYTDMSGNDFYVNTDSPYNVVYKSWIVKSSPNIIDLIERFDLVNGHLVICKMYEDEKDIPTIIKCVGDYFFKEEDIKSVVTKQQFESMEYKI